ncbi:hypothetical protein BKA81DRAFT_189393 [Phyllosticta paracitricarpa]|uniref:Uncharacterized protein n=1 Tax=Phyllosticta citricarpa TaxID=55181 RepID=A0ABR1MGS4_9PEZI
MDGRSVGGWASLTSDFFVTLLFSLSISASHHLLLLFWFFLSLSLSLFSLSLSCPSSARAYPGNNASKARQTDGQTDPKLWMDAERDGTRRDADDGRTDGGAGGGEGTHVPRALLLRSRTAARHSTRLLAAHFRFVSRQSSRAVSLLPASSAPPCCCCSLALLLPAACHSRRPIPTTYIPVCLTCIFVCTF